MIIAYGFSVSMNFGFPGSCTQGNSMSITGGSHFFIVRMVFRFFCLSPLLSLHHFGIVACNFDLQSGWVVELR